MTAIQKAVLQKINPDTGYFSKSGAETRVLNALRNAGLVQGSSWTYFLTDAGRAALTEST